MVLWNHMPLVIRLTMRCPLHDRRVETIHTIVNSRDVIIRLAELNFLHFGVIHKSRGQILGIITPLPLRGHFC